MTPPMLSTVSPPIRKTARSATGAVTRVRLPLASQKLAGKIASGTLTTIGHARLTAARKRNIYFSISISAAAGPRDLAEVSDAQSKGDLARGFAGIEATHLEHEKV